MAGDGIGFKLDDATVRKIGGRLLSMEDKVRTKLNASAASSAMTPVLRDARKAVPEATGLLKKSLGKKTKNYKRDGVSFVLVGPRNGYKDPETGQNPVNYCHLVEYGTKRHEVPGNPVLRINGNFVRGSVRHPGARMQPFLRPALDKNAPTAVDRYAKAMLRGIERMAKKR